MLIEDRIPDLSEGELQNLHANAVRLAQSGTPQQREHAERLLPLVAEALERHRAAKAVVLQEKRQAAKKKPAKKASA